MAQPSPCTCEHYATLERRLKELQERADRQISNLVTELRGELEKRDTAITRMVAERRGR